MWKSLIPSAIIIGVVYILADIVFVRHGIWGFNHAYHSDLIIAGLPLEEWLFFILIPYASIFVHFVFVAYFPDAMISSNLVKVLSAIIITLLLLVMLFNLDKAYTVFNFTLLMLALIWALIDKSRTLNRYFISFLIILIPFFIINSILTGTFIEGEVVWYNNAENLGIRIGTVPVEDIGYAFSLMLLNLLMNNLLQGSFKHKHILLHKA
jgi:lycopene cyclase domain-containing protein